MKTAIPASAVRTELRRVNAIGYLTRRGIYRGKSVCSHRFNLDTDVRRTWLLHDVGEIRDDYELTDQTDYLERAGQFP